MLHLAVLLGVALEVAPLPDSPSGNTRFLVVGIAPQEAGGDWPVQISVWEWDGLLRLVLMDQVRQSMSFDWIGASRGRWFGCMPRSR
jgi:hypothetical protein